MGKYVINARSDVSSVALCAPLMDSHNNKFGHVDTAPPFVDITKAHSVVTEQICIVLFRKQCLITDAIKLFAVHAVVFKCLLN